MCLDDVYWDCSNGYLCGISALPQAQLLSILEGTVYLGTAAIYDDSLLFVLCIIRGVEYCSREPQTRSHLHIQPSFTPPCICCLQIVQIDITQKANPWQDHH